MSRVRTDLALVRRALDLADESTIYRAGKELGIHNRTVQRWVARREREHPGWPTPDDIAAWKADQAANGATRLRKSRVAYRYKQRVYLNGGRPLQVPAIGTTRRLQALAAVGWTQKELGARLGVTGARVGHLMNGMFPTVFPETAAAVAAVFDELCMVVPTDPAPTRPREFRVHERTRRRARARGWVSALAWDDIDNDASPSTSGPLTVVHRQDDVDEAVVQRLLAGERIAATRAEKEEAARRWVEDLGRPLRRLEDIHSWKPGRYYTRSHRGTQAVAS